MACENERENFYGAIVAATSAIGIAVVTAPATFGASIIVGALTGAAGGTAIGIAHRQWARCLREHGLASAADVLEQYADAIDYEVAQLSEVANQSVSFT